MQSMYVKDSVTAWVACVSVTWITTCPNHTSINIHGSLLICLFERQPWKITPHTMNHFSTRPWLFCAVLSSVIFQTQCHHNKEEFSHTYTQGRTHTHTHTCLSHAQSCWRWSCPIAVSTHTQRRWEGERHNKSGGALDIPHTFQIEGWRHCMWWAGKKREQRTRQRQMEGG